MGIRCLLGHEYANREVEREREERGEEVVVTYRTVETCDRCGERRVVSENKEVRPIRNPRNEGVTTGLGAGGVTADMGSDADGESEPSDAAPATDDTESTQTAPASTGDDDVVADAEADTETAPDAESDPNPVEEDAVILDNGAPKGDDDGRGHGEWPSSDAETTGPAATDATDPADSGSADDGTTVVNGDDGWPEPEGDDEGFDANPNDADPTDASLGGGVAPERADKSATNGEAGSEAATGGAAGKQFVAAETVEPVGEEPSGETEFFCPNCGYARTAGGSSMRAGDICPDCHKGYIAERER
ncbi:MAG: hypothetical protein ABEH58_01295 [Haloplanus sp.]